MLELHRHFLQQTLVKRMLVEEDIGGVHRNEALAEIPDAMVVAIVAPRVLHHVVFLAILVLRCTKDQHHMVVGRPQGVISLVFIIIVC